MPADDEAANRTAKIVKSTAAQCRARAEAKQSQAELVSVAGERAEMGSILALIALSGLDATAAGCAIEPFLWGPTSGGGPQCR